MDRTSACPLMTWVKRWYDRCRLSLVRWWHGCSPGMIVADFHLSLDDLGFSPGMTTRDFHLCFGWLGCSPGMIVADFHLCIDDLGFSPGMTTRDFHMCFDDLVVALVWPLRTLARPFMACVATAVEWAFVVLLTVQIEFVRRAVYNFYFFPLFLKFLK